MVQWEYMVGLIEFAIYGGRVDNPFDNRVMVSYLTQMFNSNVISEQSRGNKRVGPMKMPGSTNTKVGFFSSEWLYVIMSPFAKLCIQSSLRS